MWTVLLTTGPATAVYVHLGRWTERLAGAVFIAFGARLVWERT
jgi:threonine/homoserine/homoserine lactone efflux protein